MGIEQFQAWRRGMASNLAEGHARRGKREFARFVSHAQGSLAELLTQLQLTIDLGYIKPKRLLAVMIEIKELSRMLNATRRQLLHQSLIPNL